MKKHIDVVGAVILSNGLILCAQRGPGKALPGLWEFPGGKIEAGETAREALSREIEEELQCSIEIGDEIISHSHEYDFGIVTLTTFYCTLITGEPKLTEHSKIEWALPSDLEKFEWAPADIPTISILSAEL